MNEHDATEIAYRNGYEAGSRACEAEIVQLSEKCKRLERERDAAVASLRYVSDEYGSCMYCKYWNNDETCSHEEYKITCSKGNSKWEWRGVDE